MFKHCVGELEWQWRLFEGAIGFHVYVNWQRKWKEVSRLQEISSYPMPLFVCSLTRAIHLDLLPKMSTEEFMRSLKKFIARRGKPEKNYSDDAKTFEAAGRRMTFYQKTLHGSSTSVRHLGLVKQSMYKVIGESSLNWKELADVACVCTAGYGGRRFKCGDLFE